MLLMSSGMILLMMLTKKFFDRDACLVAEDLLGKILCHNYQGTWLKAQIIETEAYYIDDKASHSSLGFTEKRKALFMPAGTIYMYYARGMDSFNVSCKGEGNAVLIKSAYPYLEDTNIELMQELNPQRSSFIPRPVNRLCRGQTLLCRALGIKLTDWDQQQFDKDKILIDDIGYKPQGVIQTTRLGISKGRDAHLPYRFVLEEMMRHCTKNPAK
jgi:DNA-3-methyladenine glycosylase